VQRDISNQPTTSSPDTTTSSFTSNEEKPKFERKFSASVSLAIGRRGGANVPKRPSEEKESGLTRKQLIMEIERAEECFVFSLHLMKKTFLNPLIRQCDISQSDRTLIYSPISSFLDSHRSVLEKMKERTKWWSNNRTLISDILQIIYGMNGIHLLYVKNLPFVFKIIHEMQKQPNCVGVFTNYKPLISVPSNVDISLLSAEQDIVFHYLSPLYIYWRWYAVAIQLVEQTPTSHPDTQGLMDVLSSFKGFEETYRRHCLHLMNLNSLNVVASSLTGMLDVRYVMCDV
jgi:hypothetical protein